MNLLKIGEIARLNNISVQTLRYYEKIGLISPKHCDAVSGYRYYHINQSAKLDLINTMKLIGMPLAQIKKLFEQKDPQLIKDNIEQQLEWIENQKKELDMMKRGAERLKSSLDEYLRAPEEAVVHLLNFPERKIFCHDSKMNIYEGNIENYEIILRELKDHVLLQNLPMIYFCNVGSIIRKEEIIKKELRSSEIFLFVDDDFPECREIELIPEGKYACIDFQGVDGFNNELHHASKLIEFIEKNDYRITGDYLCEVVTELPLFDDETRNMFIRIQIPIKF